MYDLLSIYPAKLAEYLLAVGYLLAFIPFWKYAMGSAKPAAAHVEVRAPKAARAAREARHAGATVIRPVPTGWFQVPAGVHLHPGHAWARVEKDGTVTVGADDFAHKLVGPAQAKLPELGASVAQGEAAFAIGDEEKTVPMLSPVDGTVVAVNRRAGEAPDGLDDPYGAGWLFQVKPKRLAANLHQLLTDNAAHRFLEAAGEALALRMSPELGRVMQDGGTPVAGIARAVAGEGWEALARKFFLT
jgi:glycine cleavage system H lipoate-binding protein